MVMHIDQSYEDGKKVSAHQKTHVFHMQEKKPDKSEKAPKKGRGGDLPVKSGEANKTKDFYTGQ